MVRYYKKTTVVKEYIQPTATLGWDSGALGVKGGQNLDSYIDQAGEAPKAFNGATATIVKYTGGAAPVFYWIFISVFNSRNIHCEIYYILFSSIRRHAKEKYTRFFSS